MPGYACNSPCHRCLRSGGVEPELTSYIRHKDFRSSSVRVSRSEYPPWILKGGELESYGRRLISSIGKTKRIAFFSRQENIFKISNFLKKGLPFRCFDFFSSDFPMFLDFWRLLDFFFIIFFLISRTRF